MAAMRDLARFRSTRFAPVLPEECQVNPGRYGAELAFWLCARLYEAHAIATSYPVQEDWGWLLSYTAETGDDFDICCGNVDGRDDHWLIFLRRYGRKLFGRARPPFSRAAKLIDALRSVLASEESIRELDWLDEPHLA